MKITKTVMAHVSDRSRTATRPPIRGTERGRPAPSACVSYADPVQGLPAGSPNVSC